jgi:hypothetical protein
MFVLLFPACEASDEGTIQGTVEVPFARSLIVTPSTLDLRAVTPVNGVYPLSIIVRVTVEQRSSGTHSPTVQAELLLPRSSDIAGTALLRDDGSSPDSSAGDGRYAGTISFGAARSDAGLFRVRVRAYNVAGGESNRLDVPFLLTRNNAVPSLSHLTAPDTLTLPSGGSLLIPMNVAAQDSDGLADIREVYFRSLDASDPTRKFFLKDDGGTDPSSGDQDAGDGVFSIIVQLTDGPNVRRTYRFAFQATDAFGDTSATLLHRLTVR